MRIYIAGPYSNPDENKKQENVARAERIAVALARAGHQFFCPHLHTKDWELKYPDIPYKYYIELDLGLIETWAEALFYIGSSPGADVELAKAKELGLLVFRSLEELAQFDYSCKLLRIMRRWAFYPETY